MFGFFTWLRNRRLRRENERRRLLFSYFDGERLRQIDPMKAWREIVRDPKFHLETMSALADQGVTEEAEILAGCICRVFDVKPFNDATGKGLTEAQLQNILADFEGWLDRVQKKTPFGPTSPQPMDSPPSSISPAARPEATKPLSGSGSTSTGPKPELPTEGFERHGQPAATSR